MNPKDLLSQRVQLHYAIQFMAAVGMALGEARSDESQITLDWNTNVQGFVGQKIPGTQIQVALVPQTLTGLILQADQTVATLSLVSKTMAEALDWHRAELAKLGVAAETVKLLDYPPDDFPDHPLAHGAAFAAGDAAARQGVAAFYAETRPLLAEMMAANPAASPIYIWPHHFDIATLMTYPGPTEAEAKYLGVGLSPGDKGYAEPYWYVTPYPCPDVAKLPELPVGGWHTAGWVGGVLTASQVQDESTLRTFINAAVAASKDLLGVE
ncbi:hypothetical protein [Nodosilinea nodulosa]|uniref:hypothetical protein n=1 Tax=Nodosilinea nodulosa TaxID=416001 RepID=UPI0002E47666|nr:hypothetical protein [Nodosilinea nodulosa]